MTTNTPASAAFAYVESDLADEQTLVEWRRERHAARQAARMTRRMPRLPRLLRARWAT